MDTFVKVIHFLASHFW